MFQFMQLRAAVQKWAEEEVAPRAAQIDKSNEFPNDLWKKMGSMGYLGITAPGRRHFPLFFVHRLLSKHKPHSEMCIIQLH